MEILRTEDLKKKYGEGENEVWALKGITISSEKGEFISIVGPSGSGKSTLLHLIGGLDSISSGKIYIEEKDISELSEEELSKFRRQKVGFIFQFYNLIPVLTVEENILLPILLDEKEPDRGYIDDVLKFLNIKDKKNKLPSQLSGGEQQRVAIARAVVNKPAIILADEPTGNLDTKTGSEVMELLRDLNKEYDQTILMVTHDLKLAKQADRTITLVDGKIEKEEHNANVVK
ncbi:ABC transporter related [Petrotoga mobilis SJ95]|jgi:putative ABC transport system ATP-binding protein|uniref:ABC transporter related n=1 Tax=Petrotoga mobilis (strain DSM 10674 / SJ95) TaxID=403833 RepID=A9BIQ4_PETMO|nr:ABC transporter ATP-binding protein [Petrotoga mobilis]ABX32217.1 ABC transporter related [Petrotoga mobilis SJ95]